MKAESQKLCKIWRQNSWSNRSQDSRILDVTEIMKAEHLKFQKLWKQNPKSYRSNYSRTLKFTESFNGYRSYDSGTFKVTEVIKANYKSYKSYDFWNLKVTEVLKTFKVNEVMKAEPQKLQ